MDMFEMANNTKATDGTTYMRESARCEVIEGMKVELGFEVETGSVKINGLEETTDTAAAGKFKVATSEGKTTITLASGDAAVGDTIRVSYKRKIVDAHIVSVKTDSTSAKGELTMHVPVYSSGTDCSEASRKGYVHIYVPSVRVTAQPGFDSSYKTASTNAVTFQAIDAQRADKKMYDVVYEMLDENGEYITA